MTPLDFLSVLAILWMVCLVVFDHRRFGLSLARDRLHATMVATLLWQLAVTQLPVSRMASLALQAPGAIVFVFVAICQLRTAWKSRRASKASEDAVIAAKPEVVTIRETVSAERARFLDRDGPSGEWFETGRSFRSRYVVYPGGVHELLSVDVQHVPGGEWTRQPIPATPAKAS